MPTVSEYRDMLNKAVSAGDKPAMDYFQGQIAKGEAMPQQAAGPTPDRGSIMDPIAQGVSLGFADEIGGGIGGLHSLVTGGDFGEGYRATRDDMRDKAASYGERHPYISTGAEIASGAALPLGVARSLAQGIRLGAVAGGVTGLGKNEDPDKLVQDAAVGGGVGALGGGVGSALGGLYRSVVPGRAAKAALPSFQNNVRTLERNGIPVTPGERIASPAARQAENVTHAYFGAGDELAARPQQLYSQLMGRSNFDPADANLGDLSAPAVERARQRFNNDYTSTLRFERMNLADMDPHLARIEQGIEDNLLDVQQKPEMMRILNNFRNIISGTSQAGNNSGQITGLQYKQLQSRLKKAARTERKGMTPELGQIYDDMRDALDTAFRASATPGAATRLGELDSQYGGYKLLQGAANDPENINKLATATAKAGRRVDTQFAELLAAYQNTLLRGAPRGGHDAHSGLMPPVIPMLRTVGAQASAAAPRFPQLPAMPAGLPTSATGQAAGLFGQAEGQTAADRERKRSRRRRYKDRD